MPQGWGTPVVPWVAVSTYFYSWHPESTSTQYGYNIISTENWMRRGKSKKTKHVWLSVPDERAQCPQPSIDLSYIEVEGAQLHQPGAKKY
jgi:hypothetical protein